MRDILIGLLIIIVVFLVVDFIHTEKNTCLISSCTGCIKEEVKCGLIKKELKIDIYLFDRYW